MNNLDVAILIPCYNEALTITNVIHAFQETLPNCTIYVYDNYSTDNTLEIAKANDAIVRKEPNKGKGNVVRRMFADIEADIYVLIDGDDTYDVKKAPALISALINKQLDMVVGARTEFKANNKYAIYRFGHRIGNAFFSKTIEILFGKQFHDVFSGYRVFSRRFTKSFPANASGFDIETEFTVHSLELRLPTTEIATAYRARPAGSESKLSSVKDGFKILIRIISLLKAVRPLLFFGSLFVVLALASLMLFYPVLISYLHTGLVKRFPTAILSTGLMLLAFMSLGCGIILDNVCHARREMKRLFYLRLSRFRKSQ